MGMGVAVRERERESNIIILTRRWSREFKVNKLTLFAGRGWKTVDGLVFSLIEVDLDIIYICGGGGGGVSH